MESFSRREMRQNRRVTSGGGFSPRNLPGLALWLRADLGISIGTGVSAWADQSGNGNNFTQGTGANQPGFAATGNARGTGPALTFNGTTQFLAASSAVLGNANVSLFMVLKTTNAAGAQIATAWGSTGGTTGWGPATSGGSRFLDIFNVNSAIDASATTNWEEWSITRDSTTWALSVNGASQSLTNATTTPAAQSAGAAIGAAGSSGSTLWVGAFDEVIGYSRKLAATEQAQVEAYIRARTAIW